MKNLTGIPLFYIAAILIKHLMKMHPRQGTHIKMSDHCRSDFTVGNASF